MINDKINSKAMIKVAFLLICTSITHIASAQKSNGQKDFVPDQQTAIKIATAVWLPIYGDGIYKKRPFKATLLGDTMWVVQGTAPKITTGPDGSHIVTYGGVPYIEIRKTNCTVLKVTHGK